MNTRQYKPWPAGTLPCLLALLSLLSACAGDANKGYLNQPRPESKMMMSREKDASPVKPPAGDQEFNTEEYKRIEENPFLKTIDNPLSTFSIDVDTASYANIRRFLNSGSLPPKDAVRIEECVNYFPYNYPEPEKGKSFSFLTELSDCPWNADHKLLLVGLKAKRISFEKLPPNNIVFLLDVSGSMNTPDKLPLLKAAMKLLVGEMRELDTVSIVVYAGAAGLVLPPTNGREKRKIAETLDRLEAGGTTAGGAGIQLAYKTAKENFIRQGNNRVILATDGDFNVGASSEGELVRMIEEKREEGIFLTVLGFGTGNVKDSKMEMLADKGNGNYAYIDGINEAKKVLVSQMGGTLVTIAKDVKIQIEFNPARVAAYRLIGYENRLLRPEDFADDTKDAGELGSGHTVTAFYELVPAEKDSGSSTDTRYTTTEIKPDSAGSDELLFIKFRSKEPSETESKLLTEPVPYKETAPPQTSESFRFASAVVEFGLLLRDSAYKGRASWAAVRERAHGALGKDEEGYRKEFLTLVEKAKSIRAE